MNGKMQERKQALGRKIAKIPSITCVNTVNPL
jgi:hypothetical protein